MARVTSLSRTNNTTSDIAGAVLIAFGVRIATGD
jgi:hypothetical protein